MYVDFTTWYGMVLTSILLPQKRDVVPNNRKPGTCIMQEITDDIPAKVLPSVIIESNSTRVHIL